MIYSKVNNSDTGNPFEDHSSHDWSCTENWSAAPDSDVTVNESQLIWTKDEWNKTEDTVNWQLTEESTTTHSWSVGGSVRTDLQSGVLTKVIADGRISVEVNGELSGSDQKKRTVSIDTTIQECRGKGRREYVDDYNATVTIEWADRRFVCSDGHGEYWIKINVASDSSSTGDGDAGATGEFIDLGPWHQDEDDCFHCYQAS